MTGNNGKLAFSLKSKKASVKRTAVPADGFEEPVEAAVDEPVNPDLPKEPLVIPVQKDGRQSLQEQSRQRREKVDPPTIKSTLATPSAEDVAAIEALSAEAAGESSNSKKSRNLTIEGAQDTFQRGGAPEDSDKKQFQEDLDRLAPEVSVDSQVYRHVPIGDFGAAMLRGMGWTGTVDKSDKDQNLPRPSRLGLGATPKMLDVPTHSRRPRRQDQVKRDEQMKQQQQEYEQKRQQQIKLDKQQTLQVGSIVQITMESTRPRRGIVRQWQGVPGLNMALVQYEGAKEPTKVKKGTVRMMGRKDLEEEPFEEPEYRQPGKETKYLGNEADAKNDRRQSDDRKGDSEERRHSRRRSEDESKHHRHREDRDRERRRRDEDPDRKHRHSRHEDERYDRHRRSRDDEDSDGHHKRRRHSDRESDSRKKRRRERDDEERKPPRPSTWLIANIRVRVVTRKLGKEYYKEKGVVMDVSAKGTATLTMSKNGQVLQVPERYLETALPKVGGNACVLTGKHRWSKGKLLERDSSANKGAVQVFEDMNIVNCSLDDMAEWCGPLDDDLME